MCIFEASFMQVQDSENMLKQGEVRTLRGKKMGYLPVLNSAGQFYSIFSIGVVFTGKTEASECVNESRLLCPVLARPQRCV